jgi:integrase
VTAPTLLVIKLVEFSWSIGSHRLSRLRPDHVQAMLDGIADAPALRPRKPDTALPRPVTAGTLTNIRAVLRAALNEAMRLQLVSRNVALLVTIPTPRRGRPMALPEDRLRMFLKGLRGETLESLFFFVAVYGPRRGEPIGLRWDDVDEVATLIHIRSTVVEVEGDHLCPYCARLHRRLLFETPKSRSGERIYPLVPSVAAALKDQRIRQAEERELYGDDYRDHGLVFCQPEGNPWRPDWISREFRRLMKASGAAEGLPRIPPLKTLRSTMVTNLHEAGTPLEVISRITGHAGGDVTRDFYLAIAAERTRAQFSSLAEAMDSPWSERSDHLSDHTATEPDSDDDEEVDN